MRAQPAGVGLLRASDPVYFYKFNELISLIEKNMICCLINHLERVNVVVLSPGEVGREFCSEATPDSLVLLFYFENTKFIENDVTIENFDLPFKNYLEV